MLNLFRNIFRSLQILGYIIFYIVMPVRKSKKVCRCFEALGPVFIKLGQSLSTRPDVVGEEVAEELSKLRDDIKPFSYSRVPKLFKQEFGKDIEDLFSQFDKKPVAAASIAQVHKAKTFKGEQVAVKILRPKIDKIFRADISLFYSMAKMLEFFSADARRLKLVEVVRSFEDMVTIELDLRYEAAPASELRDNLKDDPNVYIPLIDWELTSKKILTLEWVEGVPIHKVEQLKEKGHDLVKLSKNLAICFFNQAYRDGFFHADTHQGNLFVNDAGQIVIVDFGIMGRLDANDRKFVAEIFYGFYNKDYDHVARVHFEAGYVPKDQPFGEFKLAIRTIGEPIIGKNVLDISIGKLMSLLFQMTRRFNMQTQPQLLLLQKSILLIEGVGAQLNSQVNIWKLAGPWIQDWAIANIGPEAKLRDKIKQLGNKLFDEKNEKQHIIIESKNNLQLIERILLYSLAIYLLFINFK